MGVMTIPAQIAFSMRSEIDPGDLARRGRAFRVALSAEFPAGGLCNSRHPGIHQMLFGNGMTSLAGQGNVMGDPLFRGDLPVAGAAFLGFVRQKRIVGIMAGHAGLTGIMKRGDNLGETGWARRVIAVAERTVPSPSGSDRFDLVRGIYMVDRRAVADFAGNISVI